MTETTNVGIWIRVSTEKQVRDESPEHHEHRARHYIEAKGWRLTRIYRLEGVSGKNLMRHPETKRMLQDIKSGTINGLVFSKLARLARSTRQLLEFADIFRTAKANLISLSENIDTGSAAGMLFFTIISAMAEWEREEIASRISASIPVRAKLGKSLGGQAAFGYSWKDKQFVVNESEAPVRKLMYEIFLRTLRRQTTAEELNRLGHRTRKGALFSGTTIGRLLRDTTAKGERIANYTRTTDDGKRIVLKPKSDWTITSCPPIVPKQIWESANLILAEQQTPEGRIGRRSLYLFAGFVRCSCSKKMYVKRSRFYKCRECNIKMHISDVEEIFLKFLTDCMQNINLTGFIENSRKSLTNKRVMFEEALDEKVMLEKTVQRHVAMRTDGWITKEKFVSELHLLNAKLAGLETFLQKIQIQLDTETVQLELKEERARQAMLLVSDWTTLDFQRKRTIIETVTKRISIGKQDVDIELYFHHNYNLDAEDLDYREFPFTTTKTFGQKFQKPIHQKYVQNPVTIGEHIRKKRVECVLSQAEVASILGVSTDCVTYWENNRSTPQISYYPKIHQFLGYCITEFDETTYAGRIKAYRWKNGLTYKKMGKLLGADGSTITAWEKGESLPSKARMEKFDTKLKSYL